MVYCYNQVTWRYIIDGTRAPNKRRACICVLINARQNGFIITSSR